MKTVLAAVLLCVGLALSGPAQAEEYPVLSMARVSAALGVNYAFYHAPRDPADLPAPIKEFEVGPYLSYNMVATTEGKPLLSLAGSSLYGLDTKVLRTSVGLRLILYTGGSR